MPITLEPWFLEKYSLKPDQQIEQPAPIKEETKTSSFLKKLSLLKEPGDTQQQRELLSPEARTSTERKIDPIILDRLSESPLSSPPQIQVPAFQPGKRVFTNQEELDKIIAEAPESNKIISFNEAFRKARQAGMSSFEYKGDQFNTRQKDETNEEWLLTLKQNKTPQNFTDYMGRTGVTTAEGKKINLSQISIKLGPALERIAPIFKAANITPEITSGQRNWGKWSLHEIGEAIDMRLKTANPKALKQLEDALPGKPVDTFIEGETAQMWTDGDYQYFIYGKGKKLHLHIERDIPETKKKLIEYMIKQKLTKEIPTEELKYYFTPGK